MRILFTISKYAYCGFAISKICLGTYCGCTDSKICVQRFFKFQYIYLHLNFLRFRGILGNFHQRRILVLDRSRIYFESSYLRQELSSSMLSPRDWVHDCRQLGGIVLRHPVRACPLWAPLPPPRPHPLLSPFAGRGCLPLAAAAAEAGKIAWNFRRYDTFNGFW